MTFEALPEGRPFAYADGESCSVDKAMNTNAALSHKPSLVIISFPSNDATLGYSASRTLANLQAISDSFLAEGIAVLVLDAQPRSDRNRHQVHQELSTKLRGHFGPCFVPLYRAHLRNEELNTDYDLGDGVHPNDAGHSLILKAIQQRLNAGDCVNIDS